MSDSHIPSFLMSDVSELLRSLTKNERIARFFEQITHSLIFSQKTSDSLRKPTSKFQAMGISQQVKTTDFNILSFLLTM